MLPDLPRNSDPTILAMSSMANSGGSQAEATAVHSILDMGPFPLASMLQRGVLIDSSPRHSAHWKVSIESVLQGISALLDAASNKVRECAVHSRMPQVCSDAAAESTAGLTRSTPRFTR